MSALRFLFLIFSVGTFVTACGKRSLNIANMSGALGTSSTEVKNDNGPCNPDLIYCKLVNSYTNFIMDSFERADVIDPSNSFGWRKIINDAGKVISGQAGKHVDVQIYSVFELGPASDGNRAIYNFGRQGNSIHNIYLITKTFDLNQYQGDSVVIQFDYLPIGLEADEYLKLEVCNDTAENCGVGNDITVDGLNSNKWIPVFETYGLGDGKNGLNHAPADYITEKVVLFLEDFQKKEFIFRFNSRVDNGFIDNDHTKGMEDGLAIDNIRATSYDLKDGVQEAVEDPKDVLDLVSDKY